MKVQIIETSCYRRRMELERVKNYFEGNGWSVSPEDFEVDNTADVIIHSTCGFTQAAEDFGLNVLNNIKRLKKSSCRVIVGGCLPKINPGSLNGFELFDARSYEKLDEYMKFDKKLDTFSMPNIIKKWDVHTAYREHGLTKSDEKDLDEIGLETREENTKVVKEITEQMNYDQPFRIQCLQGCGCNCTYCAIKLAIGDVKSKPLDVIENEITNALSKGFNRISFECDSLGSYGLDIGHNIGDLLNSVIKLTEGKDVKLDITDVSPAFLKFCHKQLIELAKMDKITTLYIPVQSASQKILNKMRRGYNIDEVKVFIEKIQRNTDMRIGTSIIIGFPGETLDDLSKTIKFCQDIEFDYVICHSFSSRNGTIAADLPDHLSGEEILNMARIFKDNVKGYTKHITIAEDTKGNRTCQG